MIKNGRFLRQRECAPTRDLTLLSVLYDTGARVQELIDLRILDISIEHPTVLTLTGKGNKVRRVPIMKNTTALLRSYLQSMI